MKRRIGLVGYFGWGNFGDELFVETHRQYLPRHFDLEIVHDLLAEPYFSRPIGEVVGRHDSFLIGGGDLLNPNRVSSLYWRMEYLQKPVFVMGLGVPTYKAGGNKDAIEHFRAFFRHPNCKLVILRDPESAKWMREVIEPTCPVEWRPDPVCAMSRPQQVKSERKTLGVVMRSHRSFTGELRPVRKLIDKAKEQDYAVKHLVLGTLGIGEADASVAKTLAKEDEEVVVSESLDGLCAEISSCSLLATIKFHGMIVATMYGIPSIALSVTPKNRNFLKMIARPEMLGGYNQPDIHRLVSYYPAQIHPLVASKLFRDAKSGYELLVNAMENCLGTIDQAAGHGPNNRTDEPRPENSS